MKILFAATLAILLVWSTAVWLSLPEQQQDKPVLYWMTDPNPERQAQIDVFHEWLATKGYPDFELRTDIAGNQAKVMIQGISGVGGDLIDAYYADGHYYSSASILEDVSGRAAEHGISLDMTYEAIRPSLMHEGKFLGFPAVVSVKFLLVNKDAFARFDLPAPPQSWDIETFERIGSEYVRRANEGERFQKYFFVDELPVEIIRQSMGVSIFNETLSASALDHAATAETLALYSRWVNELNLIPSASENASIVSGAGSWAAGFHMLSEGNFAMLSGGRWGLTQIRAFKNNFEIGVARFPHVDFENTIIYSRTPTLYRNSQHKDLAMYFMEFLTSPEYNQNIIETGDALPPVKEASDSDAFRFPEKYPNEWDFHKHLPKIAEEIAIPVVICPYVPDATVQRIEERARHSVLSNMLTPEEAQAYAHSEINKEIRHTLADQPQMREGYEERLRRQREIDRYKAEGLPIPADLIDNPFYLKYYRNQGMLDE